MDISFTDRELDVMAVLWQRGSGTVAEVRDALDDELAYTTVLTVILGVGAVAVERLVEIWRAAQRFVWLIVVLAAMIGPVALATLGTLPVTSPLVAASAAGFATRGAHLVALPPAQPRTRNTGIAAIPEQAI